MKAQDLNGTHLGHRFKITVCSGAVVVDTLVAIEHEADIITDETLGSAEPDIILGRRRTGLTFLNAGKVGTVYPHVVEMELADDLMKGSAGGGPHEG